MPAQGNHCKSLFYVTTWKVLMNSYLIKCTRLPQLLSRTYTHTCAGDGDKAEGTGSCYTRNYRTVPYVSSTHSLLSWGYRVPGIPAMQEAERTAKEQDSFLAPQGPEFNSRAGL